ncbi:GNAT family N-acetyltransferase [Maricaulis sp.]|uniref:GNAT family N-acetyltransferase n=1 Tax=Maricaulis sp. TaxID=1486257 RepID=UPI00263685BF|nr:GNAT family N-acetyltransferase [Maricaulis sp.]
MARATLSAQLARIDALSPRERQYWQGFCEETPELASPYFTLEFAELCAAARRDTRVLTISQNGTPFGFLPLHVSRTGLFRPLGGPMGDHHGVIAADGDIDISQALKLAGLGGVFSFNGALASQAGFARLSDTSEPSWVCDMSDGFDTYWDGRQAAEAKAMRNLRARERKLAEAGHDIVYRIDDRRVEALDWLVATKRAQYAATGATDVFRARWARTLAYSLMMDRSDALGGILSTMEIDGQMAAAHFGMRSASVLHYWFPVYDPAYSTFSPGLMLFRELLRETSQDGIREAHLGPGSYDFKKRFANASFDIAQGCACNLSLTGAVVRIGRGIDRMAQALPIGPLSELPGKAMRRLDRMTAIYGI